MQLIKIFNIKEDKNKITFSSIHKIPDDIIPMNSIKISKKRDGKYNCKTNCLANTKELIELISYINYMQKKCIILIDTHNVEKTRFSDYEYPKNHMDLYQLKVVESFKDSVSLHM